MEVGREVECCVLEWEGEVVRVSLNPALVEGCRGGESGVKQTMVSGNTEECCFLTNTSHALPPLSFPLSLPPSIPAAADWFCGWYGGGNHTPLPPGSHSNPSRHPASLCCHGLSEW